MDKPLQIKLNHILITVIYSYTPRTPRLAINHSELTCRFCCCCKLLGLGAVVVSMGANKLAVEARKSRPDASMEVVFGMEEVVAEKADDIPPFPSCCCSVVIGNAVVVLVEAIALDDVAALPPLSPF